MIILSKDYLRSTRSLTARQLAQILESLQSAQPDDFPPNQSHTLGVADQLQVALYRHESQLVLLQAGPPCALKQWLEDHIVRWDTSRKQFVCYPRPSQSQEASSQQLLFRQFGERELLNRGLPEEHLANVKRISSLNQLARLGLSEPIHEKLLSLLNARYKPYNSPEEERDFDSQHYFVASSLESVQALLSAPMEEWVAFLHPHQKDLAHGSFPGTILVTGGAGTGKTVVAMHRARQLARRGKKVILTCFSRPLKNNLHKKMQVLCSPEELKRIDIYTLHELARKRCKDLLGIQTALGDKEVEREIQDLVDSLGKGDVSQELVWTEYRSIIRPLAPDSFEEYSASRAGRGRTLTRRQKNTIWKLVSHLQQRFRAQRACDFSGLCQKLAEHRQDHPDDSPFDAIVADEIQDFGPCELRMLRALTAPAADDIMLFGDAGQRIFLGNFDLLKLGFHLAEPVHCLSVVYRTTEEIRKFSEEILPENMDNLGGGLFDRGASLSLLSGPPPQAYPSSSSADQANFVVSQIQQLVSTNLGYRDFAVFAQARNSLKPVQDALLEHSIPCTELDRHDDGQADAVRLGTMHAAKGLEFKVVFVIDASKNKLPDANVLKSYHDEADRDSFREAERSLFYVAVTRARDQVFVCYVREPSEFLAPLLSKNC